MICLALQEKLELLLQSLTASGAADTLLDMLYSTVAEQWWKQQKSKLAGQAIDKIRSNEVRVQTCLSIGNPRSAYRYALKFQDLRQRLVFVRHVRDEAQAVNNAEVVVMCDRFLAKHNASAAQ